eukprot:2232717-Amphidinium_carterae.2
MLSLRAAVAVFGLLAVNYAAANAIEVDYLARLQELTVRRMCSLVPRESRLPKSRLQYFQVFELCSLTKTNGMSVCKQDVTDRKGTPK